MQTDRTHSSEEIALHTLDENAKDICVGADPFLFHQEGQWHLLLQEHLSEDPLAHDGIKGYTIRSAPTIEELSQSAPIPLTVSAQPSNLKQVWAAEIHFGTYMYVAMSDGNNHTHRMHVYKSYGNVYGPWEYIGPLKVPKQDERWAIDLTLATIRYQDEDGMYAIWSGWEELVTETTPENFFHHIVPQSLYIAEFVSPIEIGERHLLCEPHGEWCSSIAPILEGPQTLTINGRFEGMLVTGNASWTDSYATNVLKYGSGDPLNASSWAMHPEPLFRKGGIGHGMIVEQHNELYYVGHRKTLRAHGWNDRMVFYTRLPHEAFRAYLQKLETT
jgi:hypothetical protein